MCLGPRGSLVGSGRTNLALLLRRGRLRGVGIEGVYRGFRKAGVAPQ
jgi:hypothetical protein